MPIPLIIKLFDSVIFRYFYLPSDECLTLYFRSRNNPDEMVNFILTISILYNLSSAVFSVACIYTTIIVMLKNFPFSFTRRTMSDTFHYPKRTSLLLYVSNISLTFLSILFDLAYKIL